MAKKIGRVTRISQDGWAMVITEKGDACNHCESTQFCHSLADCARVETRVLNRADAGAGDQVSISLSSTTVLKSALILYMLPTAGLLFGALAGKGLSNQLGIGETGTAILFGFAGLLLGFTLAKFISKRLSAGHKLSPVITRIIRPITGFYPSRIPARYRFK